jgi:hypothetical protein
LPVAFVVAGRREKMPAKPLTDFSLDRLHAARQACLTLLLDQPRIYLDGGSLPALMLVKLRDDAGEQLGVESPGKSTAIEPRDIGEATDGELKSMGWAVAALLDRCRAAIGDPALIEYLTIPQASVERQKAEREAAQAAITPKAS